jgi:AcrR family transcriptional regulator
MGRPVHADGRQTRLAILDAALDLLADKGYFGTSLRDIASRVGVRESALYNYFSSKEALFDELLATARESKQERLAEFLEQPLTDVRAALEDLTTRILDYFCEPRQQLLFLVLSSDGMRLAKQGRLDLVERMTSDATPFRELMRRLIADGHLKAADPELLVTEFLGPLLMWRQCHAVNPAAPVVVERNRFCRDHVQHFLSGAQLVSAVRTETAFRQTPASMSVASTVRPPRRSKVTSQFSTAQTSALKERVR